MLNSLNQHHKNYIVDSQEIYKVDLEVNGVKLSEGINKELLPVISLQRPVMQIGNENTQIYQVEVTLI